MQPITGAEACDAGSAATSTELPGAYAPWLQLARDGFLPANHVVNGFDSEYISELWV